MFIAPPPSSPGSPKSVLDTRRVQRNNRNPTKSFDRKINTSDRMLKARRPLATRPFDPDAAGNAPRSSPTASPISVIPNSDMPPPPEDAESSVQVAVRIRPLSSHEEGGGAGSLKLFPHQRGLGYDQDILQVKSSSESTISTKMQGDSESECFGGGRGPNATLEHSSLHKSMSYGSATSNQNSFVESYQTIQMTANSFANPSSGSSVASKSKYVGTFNQIFPSTTPQEGVYNVCVTPLVQSCLAGYNATVLAYGQTGSGKTHTILGDISTASSLPPNVSDDGEGVIPRALRSIFYKLQEKSTALGAQEAVNSRSVPNSLAQSKTLDSKSQVPFEYQVKIQFLELYGEELRDLLSDDPVTGGGQSFRGRSNRSERKAKKQVSIRDGKAGEDAEVLGAQKINVSTADEAMVLLRDGLKKRVVGKTAMNAHSSRSHAIFTVLLRQITRTAADDGDGGEKMNVEMKTSKFFFVDLCGSERAKRAQTKGKRLKEGIDINKGLLVLGNVIAALGSSQKNLKRKNSSSKLHVPYRDSKLTRLLKGSLGGNHKTLMIACISPAQVNANESINTLRYANRAKNIQNHAKVNVDAASRAVNELRTQVSVLAAELLRIREQNVDPTAPEGYPFSLEFLKDLVGKSNPSISRTNSLVRNSTANDIDKSTHSAPGIGDIRPVSWHLEEGHNLAEQSTSPEPKVGEKINDSRNSTNDTEIELDIASYDFALTTLKETLQNVSERSAEDLLTERSENEEEDRNEEVGEESATQELQAPMPSASPELKDLRGIDELHDYLRVNTFLNEDGDVVDNDRSVVSEVLTDQLVKLDAAISHNKMLLDEMYECQSVFEGMKSENDERLTHIDQHLAHYEKVIKDLENSLQQLEDDDVERIQDIVTQIQITKSVMKGFKEEKLKLLEWNQVPEANTDNMRSLKHSLETMERQRNELTKLHSTSKRSDASDGQTQNGDNKPAPVAQRDRKVSFGEVSSAEKSHSVGQYVQGKFEMGYPTHSDLSDLDQFSAFVPKTELNPPKAQNQTRELDAPAKSRWLQSSRPGSAPQSTQLSTPRSMFDVVDDSVQKVAHQNAVALVTHTESNDFTNDDDSGGDEILCAGVVLNAIRSLFVKKNPVLRTWDL